MTYIDHGAIHRFVEDKVNLPKLQADKHRKQATSLCEPSTSSSSARASSVIHSTPRSCA